LTKISESTKEILGTIPYDPTKEPKPFDVFGPLTLDTKCISLPEHVKVQMISKSEDIKLLD